MDTLTRHCYNSVFLSAIICFIWLSTSDISNDVTPNERVFVSEEGNRPAYDAPMCSTFCKYTGSPKIRTLRRPETSDEIPFDAALCEPCDSVCQLETTQNATKPSTSIEIDSTTDVITTGTKQITSVPSVSTDIDRTITITPQKTTLTGTSVKNTVSEILSHYTGLIIAGGLIISGLLVVIAIYCLIKKRQKDPSKYTSTNVTNEGEEKVSHIYSEPSEVYHEYSEPSEVYHEYSEPSEVYHEYSEPSRVYRVYRGRQHGYEETIFQE
ncbi:Hypothetical predicted protein [Mytilus galloprovincialis]|uniref:Uncharacterized protein n=1 Tax=Mytilus galloprovincialis TaxID=29158 RepID=A0A8B6FJK8_MYTGA|nr:Hypothetical predicted protein [Mytilus galloprovincialis]